MNAWPLLRKLLAWGLLLACAAVQAAPVAGTVISNTAQASYVDTVSGTSTRISSNTVNTRVLPVEALTLTANQSVLVAAGAPFTLGHTLTNTGNADTHYSLAASVVAGGGFAPLGVQVVQDLNGNGRVDTGEPVIGAAGVDVPVGGRVDLLLTGLVPASASAGQTAQVVLTATSGTQGARAADTDTFAVTSGAAVQVTLSASAASAAPSALVDWTATAVNTGNADAAAAGITVDGAASTGFVLRVPVATNATFVSASPSSNVGARTLYHLSGAASGSYVSALPAGAAVDAVAWALSGLPAGGTLQGQFRIQVNANAAGTISQTAYADWLDAGTVRLTPGNTVTLPLPARAPQISFFDGAGYANAIEVTPPDNPLFVQVDAALCNADPTRIDTVTIHLFSRLTGDTEDFTGVETGPNSGLFRIQPSVPTANAATHVVAQADGIMEVLRNDVVTASIASCAGGVATATTTLLVDPSGVVYESRSNQPVAGATVDLIDVTGGGNGGHPGELAAVLALDGTTPAPASVVTAADGSYSFPLVKASTYQLRVTPPRGFAFPSKLPPALQPGGRLVDAQASYGSTFAVATGPERFDVPLDTGDDAGLFVQKVANKGTAEVGDFVDYTVTVKNVMGLPLPGVQVQDRLPAGFAYVRGSARLGGAAVADPAGGTGPQLTFTAGTLAAGAQAVLRYRVRVGAGSLGGDGVNTAQASASGIVSNRASAKVQVLGGVFASDAYLVGKVFADCRREGVQSGGSPGIPGVRIYLEDGTYAVTDEEGKYSLYGLSPRTHVAKLDPTTLPAGAVPEVLNHRNAGDAGSVFVDLKNGELHQADFAVAGCGEDLRAQIAARRRALHSPTEMAQAAGVVLSATPQSGGTDARTLPASGALGLPGTQPGQAAGAATGAP
ncbi:MAG: DUF11 domain-containing protein, partial [Burkholderiales bacterium]|nr:DUF11 domain-containing protein [Burkholderiales bacterium]